VGIAAASRWPCVGDPDQAVMFACPIEGSVSLLVQVPAGQVMDLQDGQDPWDPVLVHMTACPRHVQQTRAWLRARTPEEPISCGTEWLLRHWDQVVDPIDLPVWAPVATAV
jgi:hypothetical protein